MVNNKEEIGKFQQALNNIAIPLAQTDFVKDHYADFQVLKIAAELVDRVCEANKEELSK